MKRKKKFFPSLTGKINENDNKKLILFKFFFFLFLVTLIAVVAHPPIWRSYDGYFFKLFCATMENMLP